MGGVEYQVTKVDPTDPHTKEAVYQVHKVSEEIAATLGGKVYRARIINDPTAPTVAGKVYQIVLIGDPEDPAVKGKVYNAILTGGSEAVVVGPAVSPLALPDAVAGELGYVKAFGGTEQNGTPTPTNPVDIVSNNGVLKYTPNLLDMSAENIVLGKYINNSGAVTDSSLNFYNSKYIPVVARGTYTWSTSSSISYFSVMEYGSDYAFKKRTLFSNAGTSGSITLRSDTAFVLIGSNMDSTDVTLDKIAAVDWQFEKGSSATAYTPYSPTGIYTDGTVETIAIKNNIFTLVGATYDQTIGANGTPSASANNGYSDYLAVTGGDVYNFSDRGLSGVALYDQNKVFQSRPSVNTGDYTIPAGIAYIRVNFRQSVMNDISITHTNYTATAEMLLKVGDYQDVQSIIDGVVTRNVGVKVLDGTESWASVDQYSRTYIQITDMVAPNSPRVIPAYCNYFENLHNNEPISSVTAGQFYLAPTKSIYFHISQATTSDFKTWLAAQYAADTPVIVIYPLATPTTESVAGQTLQVMDGDNVLEITQASLDELELEVEYQAAVSLTIQEVQDANLDNNVTVTIQ